MKLRNKVLAILLAIWIISIGFILIGTQWFLVNSFQTLENNEFQKEIYRVNQVIQQNLNSLSAYTADWAHWDEAYKFVLGKNPNFPANNFTLASYVTSNINFLMYFDTKGKLLAGAAADYENAKLDRYPAGLKKYIYPNSLLVRHTNLDNETHGFIALPSGIMLIAASAISNGSKKAPIAGSFITGRHLSAKLLQKIANVTKLQLSLFTLNAGKEDADLTVIYQKLIKNNDQVIVVLNKKQLAGYQLLRDIEHKPIGILRIIGPRPIYQTGIEAIKYYLITNIGLGLILLLMIWYLLRILVLRRLENLNLQIVNIGSQQDLSKRINTDSNDEISSVTNIINQFLTIIQQSHELLEHSVEERTEELKQEIEKHKRTEQELLKHKEHLAHLAHHDSLTDLPNRLYLKEIIENEFIKAQQQNKSLAILFVDFDRFKNINDAFNHTVGDQCLIAVANRLRNTLQDSAVIARLGGDEFLILLTNIEHLTQATHVAQQILTILTDPIVIDQREFYLNASIGISLFPQNGTTLEQLQRNADLAMYHAKKSGGGTFNLYNSSMDQTVHNPLDIELHLRKALTKQEFFLNFQPKFNLRQKIIVGVEVLLRWHHQQFESVSPNESIKIAEETGLIIPIGEWVLRQACLAARQWLYAGYQIPVAVNLSAVQIHNKNIINTIKAVLAETGLPPRYLEIEITETAVMQEVDLVSKKLQELHDMGIKISLDDFGKGYTAITYLKQFPINTLKIDQSFIVGIPHNQNDMLIITALIKLAHSLGLEVVAEGVETEEQNNYLLANNCDIIQGYLFSEPLDLADLLKFFAKYQN